MSCVVNRELLCFDTQACMSKREQLCFTRAIGLKGSGRMCQLHVILDNNLSTLVTSRLLSLLRTACRSLIRYFTLEHYHFSDYTFFYDILYCHLLTCFNVHFNYTIKIMKLLYNYEILMNLQLAACLSEFLKMTFIWLKIER